MLVLTRSVGQKIYIGDDIVLELLDARNGKARVGITAPKDVPILREEIRPEPEQVEAPA